ncbi:MAG TPA: helix-turn-helix transcriptional regulator [Sedimentibacter sp.]|nr:helix-turn-helix transcriptional regulator [Sedimentibacter sp.]
MDILNRILSLLDSRNVSQKELADHLGISKNTITNWKAGTSNSYIKFIPSIASFFDVSADYLLGTNTPERLSDNEIKFALFGEANVTDAQLKDVKRYAKFVLEKYGEKHD